MNDVKITLTLSINYINNTIDNVPNDCLVCRQQDDNNILVRYNNTNLYYCNKCYSVKTGINKKRKKMLECHKYYNKKCDGCENTVDVCYGLYNNIHNCDIMALCENCYTGYVVN